eukprot:TRINITY_DN13107_c0_g1_i1.p1 TRINITY_DN13107_c0_g1~~TRINITY_DN13107_c0_g1_i1.p1  ORF type:complete len:462 (+),score=100.16 TRINITY_DN13107_c0_g1_i1:33-1388(+)
MSLTPFHIISGLREFIQSHDENHRKVTSEDFFEIDKRNFEVETIRFEMKSYYPNVFADLRKRNGIDTDQFMESFSLPEDHANTMTESTGRSGSFFYRTPDHMFFYKTLLRPEVDLMKSFIVDYWKHLRKYKKSFIMRMYGLYRVTVGVESTFILIMGSVFPRGVELHETFDLKGRKPKPGKSAEARGVISNSVLKDNEIARKLGFEHIEDKFFFSTQLEHDVELFTKHQIMDYSLLVGVHYVTQEEWEEHLIIDEIRNENTGLKKMRRTMVVKPGDFPDVVLDSSSEDSDEEVRSQKARKKEITHMLNRGEIRSVYDINAISGVHPISGEREVYFFGIIDCLTGYVFGKKVANFFKQFIWDKETLSTVKANFYADRFMGFMKNELIFDESVHTDMLLEEPIIDSESTSEIRNTIAMTETRKEARRNSSGDRRKLEIKEKRPRRRGNNSDES